MLGDRSYRFQVIIWSSIKRLSFMPLKNTCLGLRFIAVDILYRFQCVWGTYTWFKVYLRCSILIFPTRFLSSCYAKYCKKSWLYTIGIFVVKITHTLLYHQYTAFDLIHPSMISSMFSLSFFSNCQML